MCHADSCECCMKSTIRLDGNLHTMHNHQLVTKHGHQTFCECLRVPSEHSSPKAVHVQAMRMVQRGKQNGKSTSVTDLRGQRACRRAVRGGSQKRWWAHSPKQKARLRW